MHEAQEINNQGQNFVLITNNSDVNMHRIVTRALFGLIWRVEHPSVQAGGPWVTVARGNLKRVPAGQEKGAIGIQGIGIRTERLGTLLKRAETCENDETYDSRVPRTAASSTAIVAPWVR